MYNAVKSTPTMRWQSNVPGMVGEGNKTGMHTSQLEGVKPTIAQVMYPSMKEQTLRRKKSDDYSSDAQ